VIYLDNAATSWPKPESVYDAVAKVMRESGGNPGRSGHRLALNAAREIRGARDALASLFGIVDPDRIAFTLNATWAINIALKGCLKPGDHVICGSMEHNAVARPLHTLERRGFLVSRVPSSPSTGLDPDAVRAAIRPDTRLVVTCHASNVSGAISPISEIGALCRGRGIVFLVDAAQSAGSIPIDVEAMCIDMLAFPGHKGLLGPQGTGGLYVSPSVALSTVIEGGTGSESRSLEQPDRMPDRFESGTPNTPGIAGLGAAARFVLERGVEAIGQVEAGLCARLADGLSRVPGVTVYGPSPGSPRASVVTISIAGIDPADAAAILDDSFGIASRAGLHCAPDAHESLGTLETGALRLSPGAFTSDEEIDACVNAIRAMAAQT
jgi:cysteine desulfurase family protein